MSTAKPNLSARSVWKGIAAAACAAAIAGSPPAVAQDEGEDGGDAGARRSARDFEGEIVREVVRGFYMKADIGSTVYFNTHGVTLPSTGGPLLSGVMALQLGLGGDFIDRERFSASWEAQFGQGLFNGPRFEEISATPPLVQGDIHTFSGTATLEMSTYLSRRFGIGGRAGGGVMYIPLLMNEDGYLNDVVSAWGGVPARLHEGPLPMVVFGPTIEYYTKLSHFSVGVDVDMAYVIGFDLGLSPYGYLKYTF